MSLARLWCEQDKRQEAYDVFASVYEWLTEGFEMVDLQAGKTLLNRLAASDIMGTGVILIVAVDVDDNQFTVTILNTGESFRCKASQTLLNALVAMGGRGIPSGCHGGGCGVCKIIIRKGAVETLPLSRAHVSKAEEQEGYSLACRTYPLSDIEVEVKSKSSQVPSSQRRYGFG